MSSNLLWFNISLPYYNNCTLYSLNQYNKYNAIVSSDASKIFFQFLYRNKALIMDRPSYLNSLVSVDFHQLR